MTKPQLPEAAQSAREAVAYLVNLDQAGQAAAPAPAAVDRKVLEQLPNHLAALLNAITNLWPGRERLRPDGTLERLQQEVEWHTALFQAVEEARAQKATDPLAGLRTLQVKVEQAELWAKLDAAPLWLLHGQRLALRQAYHQVRQALADALSDWIEQLLANSATAPSELDRLLHTLRDARLAQSVYQAIGDGIRKRASRSTPGPDQPASAASDLVPRSASPAPPLGRRGERAAPLGRAKPAAQRPSDKPASRK